MGKSRAGDSLDKFLSGAFSSQKYGRALIEGLGMDTTVLQQTAPVDDGEPPITPVLLTIEPFIQGLNVVWQEPPTGDYVELTHVEYTKAGDVTASVLVTKQAEATAIYELEGGAEYDVRVQFEDKWGRLSEWSNTLSATAISGAEQDIDVAELQLSGRLTNLMDAINANLLDPTGDHFEEGVINAIALAQSNNTNILTLREVDFEMWRNELYPLWNGVWPPPQTVGVAPDVQVINQNPSGQPYITADAKGHTPYALVDYGNRKWLQDTRPVGNANEASYPFSNWSQRGTVVGGYYIMSAYVRGAANATARIIVECAADTVGTSPTVIESQTFSLTGDPAGERIYVKFQLPAGKPYMRFGIKNMVAGQTLYWTRFQLEQTTALKNQPSPWTPGVFTTGVIGARMLSTIDLTAANAIFGQASIDYGLIKEVKAESIRTGSLQAGRTITCLGKIVGGGAEITDTGLSLNSSASNLQHPSQGKSDWITPKGADWSGIGFMNDSTAPKRRGILMDAHGLGASSIAGYARLLVTNGNEDILGAASRSIVLESGENIVFNGPFLFQNGGTVNGSLDVIGNLDTNGTLDVLGTATMRGNVTVDGGFVRAFQVIPTVKASFTVAANTATNIPLGAQVTDQQVYWMGRLNSGTSRWDAFANYDALDGGSLRVDNTLATVASYRLRAIGN